MATRLNTWIVHASLALVMVVSMADYTTPRKREDDDKFVLAVSCISLIFGVIYIVAHFVTKMRATILGGLIEVVASFIILILWFVAVIILQNPKNEKATLISEEVGIEVIEYANLYFFGWIIFFNAVYLLASVFRDARSFDPKILTWSLLLFASIVLLGTSVNLKDEICDANPGKMCDRTNFAIAIGAIVMCLTFVGIFLLICMGGVKPMIDLVLSGISAVLYFFGVCILTSASGPARTLGTLYFAIWAGAGFSYMLLIQAFREVFFGKDDIEVVEARATGTAEDEVDPDI